MKRKETEEQKQRRKDKILSDLFLQKMPFEKDNLKGFIAIMCRKFGLADDTDVVSDVYSTVFLELSKKTPDYIIELFDDNPRRLVGLAVRIAQLKGFASDGKCPGSPNHSVAKLIKHTSNFNVDSNLKSDVGDWNNDQDNFFIHLDKEYEDADTWSKIEQHLTEEEKQTLQREFKNRNSSKRSERHSDKMKKIKRRIRKIVKDNKIEIVYEQRRTF